MHRKGFEGKYANSGKNMKIHYTIQKNMKCDYEGCAEWSENTDESGTSYCRKHSHLFSHIEEIVCPKGCGKLTYEPVKIQSKPSVDNILNSQSTMVIAGILGGIGVISREPAWLFWMALILFWGATQKQEIGKGKYVCKKENKFASDKDGCSGVLIDSKSISVLFLKENYERITSKINGGKNSSLTCTTCNQIMENIPINYWVWIKIGRLPGWWKEKEGSFDTCFDCSMFWFGEDFRGHSQSPVNPTRRVEDSMKKTRMKEFN